MHNNYKYTKKSKSNYRSLLDDNYDLERAYFIQELNSNEWKKVENIISEYFNDGTANEKILDKLEKYQDLEKGEHNLDKLRKVYFYLP